MSDMMEDRRTFGMVPFMQYLLQVHRKFHKNKCWICGKDLIVQRDALRHDGSYIVFEECPHHPDGLKETRHPQEWTATHIARKRRGEEP